MDAFLTENGYPAAGAKADAYIQGALNTFSKESGWMPLVASQTEETKRLNPPSWTSLGAVLQLPGGLLSAPTVVSGITATNDGEELAANQDYYLYGTGSSGNPYTQIEFPSVVSGDPRSISVTGIWGYFNDAECPADIWIAVLTYAAAISAGINRAAGVAASQSKLKQGPVEIEFKGGTAATLSRGTEKHPWIELFDNTVEDHLFI